MLVASTIGATASRRWRFAIDAPPRIGYSGSNVEFQRTRRTVRMRIWRLRIWLFRRKPKELPAPESGDLRNLPPPPDATPEFAPYGSAGNRSTAGVAPDQPAIAGVEAPASPALPPPVERITQPVIAAPSAIEASAEPAPPVWQPLIEPAVEPPLIEPAVEPPVAEVIESGLPEPQSEPQPEPPPDAPPETPSSPALVAPPRAAKYPEIWIRDRARYFSSGRYAPPPAGAESFLAPDLLFRLGIDKQRALPEAAPAPLTPAAPPLVARPAPRLMDDFTTTWDPGPPTADPSGRVFSVDPLLLTLFVSSREAGPEVPPEATTEYLAEPVLLAHAIGLRRRLLQHWASGGAPVGTRQLYDLALQIAQHPGTALLLCHNVTKAFARGGDAICWRLINRATGEYSDGESAYVPASLAGAFAAPPIFHALFAASELAASDCGYWYRYYASAAAACYAANAQTRLPVVATTTEAVEAARDIVAVSRRLRCASVESTPSYRGWLWVNAWVFVEIAAYSRNRQAAHAESVNSLRGVCFGLSQAGCTPHSGWRWAVPETRAASGADVVPIAEWLDPANI